jgi:hypothetical protein
VCLFEEQMLQRSPRERFDFAPFLRCRFRWRPTAKSHPRGRLLQAQLLPAVAMVVVVILVVVAEAAVLAATVVRRRRRLTYMLSPCAAHWAQCAFGAAWP